MEQTEIDKKIEQIIALITEIGDDNKTNLIFARQVIDLVQGKGVECHVMGEGVFIEHALATMFKKHGALVYKIPPEDLPVNKINPKGVN